MFAPAFKTSPNQKNIIQNPHNNPFTPLHSPQPPSPNPEVTKKHKETKKRPKTFPPSPFSSLLLPPSFSLTPLFNFSRESNNKSNNNNNNN